MAAPTVSIIWAGDTHGISGIGGLRLMLERMGSRILGTYGTRVVPYGGPTFDFLCGWNTDYATGGGIKVSFSGGNYDVWVTHSDVVTGPFESELLADIFIDPGMDYRLWYKVRTIPWVPVKL